MVTPQTFGQTGVMRRVFLTGASSGIGLAIAKLLVEEGHEVWGTSRNLERIPKMPRCHPVRLDLTDPLSVEAAFNAALTDAGYFDVVINNAGAGHFAVRISSPLFQNKPLVECHRLVYAALGDTMHKEIHALRIEIIQD